MHSNTCQRLPLYPEMPDAPHGIRHRRFKIRPPLVLENPIIVPKAPPLVLKNPEMPDAPHGIRHRRFKTRPPLVLENPITVPKAPPLVLKNPEIVPPPSNSVPASTSLHNTMLLMSDDFHFTF